MQPVLANVKGRIRWVGLEELLTLICVAIPACLDSLSSGDEGLSDVTAREMGWARLPYLVWDWNVAQWLARWTGDPNSCY